MAREVVDPKELERAFATVELRQLVGPEKPNGKKRRRNGSVSRSMLEQRIEQFTRMVERDDFEGALPSDLVAAYAWCHRGAYGVLPLELVERGAWERAVLSASSMLKQEFSGDVAAMLDYVRWTWGREIARQEWRARAGQANGSAWRIGWYEQFVKKRLLTDYLVKTNRVPK
jgi:hypothetical protein